MFPLAARFRDIRGLVGPADDGLENQLREVVERGRAAHPDLHVDAELFVEFLAMRTGLDDSYIGDLYLACAVMLGVPGAVSRFDVLCVSQIPRALVRIDRSATFIAEIQRRVRDKLVSGGADGRPRIGEYAARSSLVAFVRIAAIREALMEKREAARQRLDLDGPDAIASDDLLELMRREHREAFRSALRIALATLDDNERAALRLSYLDNLGVDEIGRLFNVHRATAARWIARAQVRVRDKTRAVLQRRLQLTDSEAESLVGDLLSVEALSSGMLASTVASAA